MILLYAIMCILSNGVVWLGQLSVWPYVMNFSFDTLLAGESMILPSPTLCAQ